MKKQLYVIILLVALSIPAIMWKNSLRASLPGAKEIVQKAVQNITGNNSMEAEISIITDTGTGEQTEIMLKTWQKTTENMLVLVNAPARDKGTTFLRNGKEVWKWLPDQEKLNKLVNAEITEKWMNTHLTVADILNYNSFADDFFASFKNLSNWNDAACYVIELVPNSESAQSWYRIMLFINTKNYIIEKAEYYDEDDYLITTATMLQTQTAGNRTIPQVIEWKPAANGNQKTTVEYKTVNYDPLPDSVFTLENMKEVR